MSGNLDSLSRVYGDETWQVYDVLDESLHPAGPDQLYDVAGRYLTPGMRILDAGCRDAAHTLELVRRFGVTAVGVDPVPVHIDRARAAVGDQVELVLGGMEALPFADGHFDFVWCRDVLAQVAALDAALAEAHRVLAPGGRMLVYSTFVTDELAADEAEMFKRHLGNVWPNLREEQQETAFARAGFAIEEKKIIGTEWREEIEERTQMTSRSMLRLSRLRRRRPELEQRFGADIVASIEANLHWETFQFLGKLQPTVYVLRK
jgi:ubiquinone/menaquinone biosynthesis C-methylase UbiE